MTFIQFWELTFTKVKLNLKAEARKSYLSYAWWILEPALFIGTFYLVFGVFMATQTPDFVMFLCIGKIPFLWFSRTVTNASSAIVQGKGLMNQVSIPKVFFPTVVILQDFFKSIIVFLLLFIIVYSYGFSINSAWLYLPIVIVVQLVFISAVALLGATLVPFIPDLKFIIATFVMMVMFGSGIFYDFREVILPEHQSLFLLNPMASLIDMYRQILLKGVAPNLYSLLNIMGFWVLCLIIFVFCLRKLDPIYPRLVLE